MKKLLDWSKWILQKNYDNNQEELKKSDAVRIIDSVSLLKGLLLDAKKEVSKRESVVLLEKATWEYAPHIKPHSCTCGEPYKNGQHHWTCIDKNSPHTDPNMTISSIWHAVTDNDELLTKLKDPKFNGNFDFGELHRLNQKNKRLKDEHVRDLIREHAHYVDSIEHFSDRHGGDDAIKCLVTANGMNGDVYSSNPLFSKPGVHEDLQDLVWPDSYKGKIATTDFLDPNTHPHGHPHYTGKYTGNNVDALNNPNIKKLTDEAHALEPWKTMDSSDPGFWPKMKEQEAKVAERAAEIVKAARKKGSLNTP